jgi:hypothetical protein
MDAINIERFHSLSLSTRAIKAISVLDDPINAEELEALSKVASDIEHMSIDRLPYSQVCAVSISLDLVI